MIAGLASRLLAAPTRPKLLVLVVLDHLSGTYLDPVRSQLAPGGLRRLLEKGACFPECRNLASTFPATSLATLATGAWPAQHGIVADTWFDSSAGQAVDASDELLAATTLVAQVAAENHTRVTIVSMDEGKGMLFAGSQDVRLFYMDDQGRFTTRGEVPDWMPSYPGMTAAENARDAKWLALNARSDAPPLRVLNYSESNPAEYMALYKASPFAMGAQFDFAAELIARDSLGTRAVMDLVCIVASSTELLGYETGGRSPLIEQMVLQFDRKLEALLNQLSKTPGEANFALVLAGAHGAPPEPRPELRDRMAVHGEAVAQVVDKALRADALGSVRKYVYPFLYLDTSAFRDPEPIRLAAGRAALNHPGVANFFTADGSCSTHDEWIARFRNSFHPKRSGDVMLSYSPEYVEDYGQGRGISYGSLYNYDVLVPLYFLGPQFRAGIYERPVDLVDVAPTLARVIGAATPSSSTGRVLAEALVE